MRSIPTHVNGMDWIKTKGLNVAWYNYLKKSYRDHVNPTTKNIGDVIIGNHILFLTVMMILAEAEEITTKCETWNHLKITIYVSLRRQPSYLCLAFLLSCFHPQDTAHKIYNNPSLIKYLLTLCIKLFPFKIHSFSFTIGLFVSLWL